MQKRTCRTYNSTCYRSRAGQFDGMLQSLWACRPPPGRRRTSDSAQFARWLVSHLWGYSFAAALPILQPHLHKPLEHVMLSDDCSNSGRLLTGSKQCSPSVWKSAESIDGKLLVSWAKVVSSAAKFVIRIISVSSRCSPFSPLQFVSSSASCWLGAMQSAMCTVSPRLQLCPALCQSSCSLSAQLCLVSWAAAIHLL